MKNVTEFVDKLVDITLLEEFDCYGHYPFQLFVETSDGKLEMNALALGGDVAACYNRAAKYIHKNAKKIFLSLDFPKVLDSKNDFVAVFSVENGNINMFAIPYNPETGEKYEIIKEGKFINVCIADFENVVELSK